MSMLSVIRSLGPIDARNISRDSSLKWMLFLPVFSGLLLRFIMPPITAAVERQWAFDLTEYYPFIMSFMVVLLTPLAFGVLIGFLLLDERDDDTLTALRVTPLTLATYILYRVSIPMLLTWIMAYVTAWTAGIHVLGFAELTLVGIVAAPIAPWFALLMASLANNKVQGFAVMKGAGMVLELPALAFFISWPLALLFGLIPAYWPLKLYWELSAANPNAWIYAVVGLVYQALVLGFFMARFKKVIAR